MLFYGTFYPLFVSIYTHAHTDTSAHYQIPTNNTYFYTYLLCRFIHSFSSCADAVLLPLPSSLRVLCTVCYLYVCAGTICSQVAEQINEIEGILSWKETNISSSFMRKQAAWRKQFRVCVPFFFRCLVVISCFCGQDELLFVYAWMHVKFTLEQNRISQLNRCVNTRPN